MITPRFSCSQTESSVVVSMYCPSIRDRQQTSRSTSTKRFLTVHVNPYYLRLNFPHNLLEDDASSAKYDGSSGNLTVTLTKEVKGQDFEDLDLLAKLLAPRQTKNKTTTSIEVLASTTTEVEADEADVLSDQLNGMKLADGDKDVLEAAANDDWQIPQQVPEALPPLHTSLEKPYGFLDMHSGYLRHAAHTENEVNELGPNAETCPKEERTKLRMEHEEKKWDPEHYMADYADDEYIQELLAWKHPYISAEGPFEYTEEENLEILRLPRKEYLATEKQTKQLYLTLTTLLFAYAYESRTNQLDPTPESAWTLCTLTPAFSALDPPNPSGTTRSFSQEELVQALIPSYRRSLAFPLYRSWALAEKCRIDAARLLAKGKRTVMRCLLDVKRILDHHEVYYVYSKVWVDDFCVWVQAYADDHRLKDLGRALQSLRMEKGGIGWPLEELEEATEDVEERESDSDDE